MLRMKCSKAILHQRRFPLCPSFPSCNEVAALCDLISKDGFFSPKGEDTALSTLQGSGVLLRWGPGMPKSGVPEPGVPAQGVPMSGVPAAGVPESGVPAPGVPMSGVSLSGVPMPGVPVLGVPAPGVPMTGVPAPGVPVLGVPAAGVSLPGGAAPRPPEEQVQLTFGAGNENQEMGLKSKILKACQVCKSGENKAGEAGPRAPGRCRGRSGVKRAGGGGSPAGPRRAAALNGNGRAAGLSSAVLGDVAG